ncbi:hypothetical protein CW304_17045 [Bacillus sp. UFRGS-B20]|nr:hypothetical protein CW304_17045 [Bacillus sp. UFRGS-B20]
MFHLHHTLNSKLQASSFFIQIKKQRTRYFNNHVLPIIESEYFLYSLFNNLLPFSLLSVLKVIYYTH